MKKLLGILVLGLLVCNIGFAEMRLIEEKGIKGKHHTNWISTVCIDGYKFVYMRTGAGGPGRAQSIVQFYERAQGKHGNPQPAKC